MGNTPAVKNAQGYGAAVMEIVEIKGKITLKEDSFPSIRSGKQDLDLLMQPGAIEALKLKSGDTVAVKGFKVPGPDWSVTEKSAVKVREITVNGKTYMVMGGRGGRHPGMNENHHRSENRNSGSYRNNAPGKGNR